MSTLRKIDDRTGLASDSYGFGTFQLDGRTFPAVVRADGAVIDVSDRYPDTHAILNDWTKNAAVLRDIAGSARAFAQFADVIPLPPVAHPNILAAGSNYRQHVIEMYEHNDFDPRPGETREQRRARYEELMDRRIREGIPFMWTGLHSALCGARHDVELPARGRNHDWELEVAIVIGRTGRHVPPAQALELVAGYTIVNDLGTTDTFRRTDPVPFPHDWIGKSSPTFKPAGPFIVPKEEAGSVARMRIRLSVNERLMQNALADDMIFGVERLVSYASSRVRLLPGDLILTGSPPGNGAVNGKFLEPGDVITAEISRLGRQRNVCVNEEPFGPVQN
jgi:2,4-didehydro-3-deoxy-L-rhamnonate hydrolase